jgi:hypothetical protein
VLAGVSAVLFGVSGALRNRELGSTEKADPGEVAAQGRKDELGTPTRKGEPAIDDEMAEIEAILRKRGIT